MLRECTQVRGAAVGLVKLHMSAGSAESRLSSPLRSSAEVATIEALPRDRRPPTPEVSAKTSGFEDAETTGLGDSIISHRSGADFHGLGGPTKAKCSCSEIRIRRTYCALRRKSECSRG